MAAQLKLRRRKCSEDFQEISPPLCGARQEVDSEGVLERGKGRSFVEQDKASAVQCGIFGGFSNELTAFPPRRRS